MYQHWNSCTFYEEVESAYAKVSFRDVVGGYQGILGLKCSEQLGNSGWLVTGLSKNIIIFIIFFLNLK